MVISFAMAFVEVSAFTAVPILLEMKRRRRLEAVPEVKKPRFRNRPKHYSRFPLERHLKSAVDFLRENRQAFTYDELRTRASIQLSQVRKLKALEALLRKNPNLTYDPRTKKFSYHPLFSNVKSLQDIESLVRDNRFRKTGIDTTRFADSYEGIAEDVKQLLQRNPATVFPRKLFAVPNPKTHGQVLFHNPPMYRRTEEVHPTFKKRWEEYRVAREERGEWPAGKGDDTIGIFLQEGLAKLPAGMAPPVELMEYPEDEAERAKRSREGVDREERKRVRKRRRLKNIANKHLLTRS